MDMVCCKIEIARRCQLPKKFKMNLGIDSCLEEYENIEIKYSQVNDLIINYLIHNCYDQTLQEFPVKVDLKQRKVIISQILAGKPSEARLLLKSFNYGPDIDFLLATLEFIELIKNKDYSYLEFDFSRFTNQPTLPDLISLIAFENPSSHFITQEYRQMVADKVNAFLSGNALCALESIVKQAVCTREALHEQSNEYPVWKLSSL